MSAVPFAGVGKPFQKHAERHAAGAPRESIDEFEGRAVLALPREGQTKDGERPWFSGQVVATDGSRRQFQLMATPLPPCEDGCKCSGGDLVGDQPDDLIIELEAVVEVGSESA